MNQKIKKNETPSAIEKAESNNFKIEAYSTFLRILKDFKKWNITIEKATKKA